MILLNGYIESVSFKNKSQKKNFKPQTTNLKLHVLNFAAQ